MQNLSVFFPAFNEEKNIETTVKKAIKVLDSLNLNWEIIIINDGSTDNTQKVAESLAEKSKKIRVINQENGGYGRALRAGFDNSKYDWIVYTDADGQFDFQEVIKFLEKTSQADLILGYRIKRNDPYIRLVVARGWAILMLIFFGLKLKDVDCGFKMVNRKVLEGIPALESTRGGMINAELVIKAGNFGFRVIQIGVHHYPRLYGKPTGAGMKVIITSFIELLKLRLKLI